MDRNNRQPWENSTFRVVDLEGNGHQPPDLVELAVVSVEQGEVVEKIQTWLVKPIEEITWQAKQIHGISNKDVAAAPSFGSVEQDVLGILGSHFMVAHQAWVDYEVLKRKLPMWSPSAILDTLRIAKAIYPGLPSYSLSSLLKHCQLTDLVDKPGLRPHRATYDALAAAHLFIHLARRFGAGQQHSATTERLIEIGTITPKTEDQPRLF